MIFPPLVIELAHVTKTFGSKTAVYNLNLNIGKGEVFGFLGPNGAGKTTTMKMILGLLRPDQGNITLLDEPAGTLEAKRRIGFLPEFANYYQHLTGREFLVFVGEIFGLSNEVIRERSQKLLKLVNIASEAQDRQINTYSKGMQQRIGMAQALMNDPDVLFLDEPMSGLDPIGRREMKDIILELKREGKTVFFNSHILADAQEICDTVGIIHLGHLLVFGTVKSVVAQNKSLEDVFVETITNYKESPKPVKAPKASKNTVAQKQVKSNPKTPIKQSNQKTSAKKSVRTAGAPKKKDNSA